jgi:hypothetical protein
MDAMGSTRMKIKERIDVEALLKSIGSLQDLQFRQRGNHQVKTATAARTNSHVLAATTRNERRPTRRR